MFKGCSTNGGVMGNCQGQSCETHGHGSSSGMSGNGCGCGCSCHSCQCCSCQSGSHSKNMQDKTYSLLAVADVAWMEVLKEKIKEHILASDHKINDMAKIVAQTNHERWHHKMAKQKCMENYEESLSELFDQNYQQGHSSSQTGQNQPPTPPRNY